MFRIGCFALNNEKIKKINRKVGLWQKIYWK